MKRLGKAFSAAPIRGEVTFDEPMRLHTSFRVGGPADCYVTPSDVDDLRTVLSILGKTDASLFILGEGANILVADAGIRGVVVDMQHIDSISCEKGLLSAGAGARMSNLTELAGESSLSGIEFIHGMPGSVGGSVWMNARCYDVSICERLREIAFIDREGIEHREGIDLDEYSYKKSPFQSMDAVITEAVFDLVPGDTETIRNSMNQRLADRKRKGHFLNPSVGSVFKNNRSFGEPTGRIIDALGLKGFAAGGARVAEYHANIVINAARASANDILAVIEHVERVVLEARGFELEREVLLVGEWNNGVGRGHRGGDGLNLDSPQP